MASLDASSRAPRGGRPGPCASNRTWTSTWRGPRGSAPAPAGRRRTRPAPRVGRPQLHPRAVAGSRTVRIPLPPPPAAASRGAGSRSLRGARRGPRPTGRRRRSRRRSGTPRRRASWRAAALSPIARIADGGRPDPADPGVHHRVGELGVLGEEPEAGWTASAPAARGRRDDRIDVEQVERRGPVASRADRDDPESAARPADPPGDLAAVCDEHGDRSALTPHRRPDGPDCARLDAKNASNATNATRQRPPTRLAGSRPFAIQRWTERVVVPIRPAASLGLTSRSSMCRDCRT